MPMLLTTQSGVLVHSDRVAFVALRRETPSPSEPDPEPGTPPTFRVLLAITGVADGVFLVAAQNLPLLAARFVREDIAHHWEGGKGRWKAYECLRRLADGAYFASDAGADDARENSREGGTTADRTTADGETREDAREEEADHGRH